MCQGTDDFKAALESAGKPATVEGLSAVAVADLVKLLQVTITQLEKDVEHWKLHYTATWQREIGSTRRACELYSDLLKSRERIKELEAVVQGRTVSCICGGKSAKALDVLRRVVTSMDSGYSTCIGCRHSTQSCVCALGEARKFLST
jgi:hypothetical protein